MISRIAPVTGVVSLDTAPVDGVTQTETLAISGSPTGGTFTLTLPAALKTYLGLDPATTAAIAYNATAADVQAALVALAGAGTFACTGTALPSGSILITDAGKCAGLARGHITADSAALTGGSSPTAGISAGTTGVTGSLRGWDGYIWVLNEDGGILYENYGTKYVPKFRPIDGIPAAV